MKQNELIQQIAAHYNGSVGIATTGSVYITCTIHNRPIQIRVSDHCANPKRGGNDSTIIIEAKETLEKTIVYVNYYLLKSVPEFKKFTHPRYGLLDVIECNYDYTSAFVAERKEVVKFATSAVIMMQ
jgi:hypothetical protein